MLRLLIAAALIFWAPGAIANDYTLGEYVLSGGQYNQNKGLSDASGKTLQAIPPRVLLLITVGQSNIVNIGPTAYTPSHAAAIGNFNPYDGNLYAYADPLLGTGHNGSNMAGRLADLLIAAGAFDRVIVLSLAVGGSQVAMWAPGGILDNRLSIALARVRGRGIVNPTMALLWGQGESDGNTSQGDYATALSSFISSAASAGFSGRVFVAKQTWFAGATVSAIRAAQAGVVDGTTVFAGPDADALGSSYRVADNTHFNDAGQAAYASAWYDAMVASGAPYCVGLVCDAEHIETTAGTPSGSVNMATFTYVDRSWAVDNGKTVTKFWLYTTTPSAHPIKLVRRNSAGNYDVVAQSIVPHFGGGWQSVALETPYAVANDGKEYYVGVYTAGTSHPSLDNKARSYTSADASGSGVTMTEQAAQSGWHVLAVGVTYQ
jgi:Carbohydrate esterase, sialic acid-specific acetylesterase